MAKQENALLIRRIEEKIYEVRGQRVMLDSDLAELYGVETRALVQAVKRNTDRFPEDFMFRLSNEEVTSLRSHFVISKGKGGRRYNPYTFTDHGALMLANVLKSPVAAQQSILVVRAFIRARELLAEHEGLRRKLESLERRMAAKFEIHEDQLRELTIAVRRLMLPPPSEKKRPIGYRRKKKRS